MTPEALEVVNDAIKILGPALITGLVGKLSARIQFTARLKELDRNNEFKAREYFFKHYKERQTLSGTGAAQAITTLTKLMFDLKQGKYDESAKVSLQNILVFMLMILN